jgi:predicted enzyme related to lactoylglutathione lyase
MRFTQVKIVASDPERLARFYEEALDCEILVPLTTLEDPAPRGVGRSAANIQILVMSLPGVEGGPTLELITNTNPKAAGGMLTFHVDDVEATAQRVLQAGGNYRGEITEFVGPSGSPFRFVFMTDPEGNVIDLFSHAD